MDRELQLKNIFSNALGLTSDQIDDTLESSTSSLWDSVAHMELITGIEEGFDIELEDDDLFAMSSYPATKEILQKYGISF